jgi:hypothetical protein
MISSSLHPIPGLFPRDATSAYPHFILVTGRFAASIAPPITGRRPMGSPWRTPVIVHPWQADSLCQSRYRHVEEFPVCHSSSWFPNSSAKEAMNRLKAMEKSVWIHTLYTPLKYEYSYFWRINLCSWPDHGPMISCLSTLVVQLDREHLVSAPDRCSRECLTVPLASDFLLCSQSISSFPVNF